MMLPLAILKFIIGEMEKTLTCNESFNVNIALAVLAILERVLHDVLR